MNIKHLRVNDFVFASDFKDESKVTYEKAIDFANVLKAKMHLLMVNTPNKFITSAKSENRMKKFS